MNIEALRRRCLARLTAIPELVYALTRHWILISICVCIGTGVMLAKVSTDPVVFSGRVTMALNAVDSMVADLNKRGGPSEDSGRFFSTRVELLHSDSVLRKVVLKLKLPAIFSQEENNQVSEYGQIRQAIHLVKERASEFLDYLEHPTSLDQSSDLDVQRAMSSFRKRTRVEPNPRVNTVKLTVFGNNRDRIAEELDIWFEAARQRIIEIGGEIREPLLDSRERHWQKKEQEAKEELDAFRKANPEVSKAARDLLLQQIFQNEMQRLALLREKDSPSNIPLEPIDPTKISPQVQSLRSRLIELENQLLEEQTIYGEDSDKVKVSRDMLRRTKERLNELNGGTSSVDPEERRLRVEKDLATLFSATAELRSRHLALDPQLEQLTELQRQYEDARRSRQVYEDMILQERELAEARRMSQLTLVERATVDFQPFNTYPLRQVLFGSMGALFVGVSVAILLELLTNKVRFRQDIYTEFGIPVIGVIPRR